MSKIAVYAKLTAQPGKGDELVAAFEEVFAAVNEEQGTLIYGAHRPRDNADVLWFYELYDSEDALKAHGSSAAMRAAGPKLRGLLAAPPELVVSTPLAGKGV